MFVCLFVSFNVRDPSPGPPEGAADVRTAAYLSNYLAIYIGGSQSGVTKERGGTWRACLHEEVGRRLESMPGR